MSIEYRIDTEEGIIYETFKGKVSVDDMIGHIEREGKDPLYKNGMPTIADMNQVTDNWSYFDIKRFTNYVRQKTQGSDKPVKWAVVCDIAQTNSIIKIIDMLDEAVGVPVKIRIFKEMTDAQQWIREYWVDEAKPS